MTTTHHRQVEIDEKGDLVWSGHDLGSDVGDFFAGASEYEFWRWVKKDDLPALLAALGGEPDDDVAALVAQRFKSDVELEEFATQHGIPTGFHNWFSMDMD